MVILVSKCPHCDSDAVALPSKYIIAKSSTAATGLFECPICDKPVSAKLMPTAGQHVQSGNLEQSNTSLETARWRVVEMWPDLPASASPEDVPVNVGRNFAQAEHNARIRHFEAAGMAFRRCLELALKDKAPDLKGSLHARINELADSGKLTADVAEWAHSVRELGNEAAHDDAIPTEQDIADLAAFARVVLEYLYTMPAKVARRSGSASGSEV